MLLSPLLALGLAGTARAVTIYGQIPLASSTVTSAIPTFTPNQTAAYDTTIIPPPSPPQPAQGTAFNLNLAANNASVPNLSIMQHGSFYGFSVEMSVITQLFGRNSTWLSPPMLNLMSHLVSRAGGLHIRWGGNTQDYASYVDSIPNYHATAKQGANTNNPTQTPAVLYSIDLFYMAANVSHLIPGVRWYLGIPMNDTNWRLQVAEYGQQILGNNLIGLQAGNEPDYYAAHGHRPENYTYYDYVGEFATLVQTVQGNKGIPVKNMFIAPSLATGLWAPDDFWKTGFLDSHAQDLTAIAMEHYPTNNCFALYSLGTYTDPTQTFPMFLNHQSIGTYLDLYNNTSNLARQKNLPFIMFETNTATCGGLPGISNSFGATLWALDYGLTMAARNFSHALMHFGGQNTFYNPITAPPSNLRKYDEYSVGAVFYAMMAVAEIFGKSNVSQIVDTSNNGPFSPSYAIYDKGNLDKLVFINFVDDASGANNVVGTFSINGGTMPGQVYVKYLDAPSVSARGENITWAGQTFGPQLKVDGRLQGTLNITTVTCNPSGNTCSVPVKAPQAAVVFLTNPAAVDQAYTGQGPMTYATTTKSGRHTATIDKGTLATSNGMSGKDRTNLGSTSHGSVPNGAVAGRRFDYTGQVATLGALVGGAWVVLAGLVVG